MTVDSLACGTQPARGVGGARFPSGRRVDGMKQPVAGRVEGTRGLVVAQGRSHGIELREGGPGLQTGDGVGQRLQLLVGGHDVSAAVALADATLGVDGFAGEEAGPVEIEVGREDPLGESVDPLRVAAGDVAVAEMLSDDRAVLALDQGVVGAASRAGLGERVDVQRLQQRRDFAVDELGAVVGVEAAEDERERPQEGVEDRDQARRVDMLDRADAVTGRQMFEYCQAYCQPFSDPMGPVGMLKKLNEYGGYWVFSFAVVGLKVRCSTTELAAQVIDI